MRSVISCMVARPKNTYACMYYYYYYQIVTHNNVRVSAPRAAPSVKICPFIVMDGSHAPPRVSSSRHSCRSGPLPQCSLSPFIHAFMPVYFFAMWFCLPLVLSMHIYIHIAFTCVLCNWHAGSSLGRLHQSVAGYSAGLVNVWNVRATIFFYCYFWWLQNLAAVIISHIMTMRSAHGPRHACALPRLYIPMLPHAPSCKEIEMS